MCGIFGIYDPVGAPDRDVARLTYFGLYALQHRGQESAGIAVSDGSRVMAMKDMGLVNQVFDEPKLSALPGRMAIGHARYSTTGSTVWRNAQPIVQHAGGRTIALAHNGNLTNTTTLRNELREQRVRLHSTSDTEVIAALIANHPSGDLGAAVTDTMQQIEGAFAAVVLSENAVAGFRDPDGIRPLVVGRVDDSWVLASETCALDIIGATVERELAPGELVVLDEHGAHFSQAVPPRSESLCIFEYIYFARPDTTLNGHGLYEARVEMGRRLAAESPVDADVVIPVPDSGTPGRGRLRAGAAASRSARGWSRTATSAARSSSPTRRCASAASSSSSTCCAPCSRASGWWSSTTRSSAARPPASWSRCCSRRAPARCTCASRRRRSSRPASTASTWPTRTS